MIWFWGTVYLVALTLIIAFFMGANRRRTCSRCGVPPREGLYWCIDCLRELAAGAKP